MDTLLYVGVTNFYTAPNGIWYQEAFPHKINNRSMSIGVDFVKDNFGIGYLYVGKVSSYAEAVADDANYDLNTNSCVGKCLPLSHWYGQGNVQQISLFYRSHFNRLFVDTGISINRPSWSVDIPDYRPYIDIPAVYKRVEHKPRIQYLPTISVGYTGNPSYKISLVPTVAHGDEWIAIYRGMSTNISVGYKF